MTVELSPFYGIEKGAVLQESRLFNDPQIDVRRCQQVITKLLYLINHGDYFTKVRSSLRCVSVQAGRTPWWPQSRSVWWGFPTRMATGVGTPPDGSAFGPTCSAGPGHGVAAIAQGC